MRASSSPSASSCPRQDGITSVVPYASIAGVHVWGGTDYQAWARWCFLDETRSETPEPGPGDFLIDGRGDIVSWVTMDEESICAYQGRIAGNMALVVVRLLHGLQADHAELVVPSLPRPVRRRAARDALEIGRVPHGLPVVVDEEDDGEFLEDFSTFVNPCPVENAHSRLNRAHARWHDALDSYDDPDAFVAAVNDILSNLRSATLALQNDLAANPELKRWYETEARPRLAADERMLWLRDARNDVVHAADLMTLSKAEVRIVGPGLAGTAVEISVDPSASSGEIARLIQPPVLSDRARREGILVVERRWVVDALPDEELLDVLSYGHATVARIVAEAHLLAGRAVGSCRLTGDDCCQAADPREHPSGRFPCTWASREARTSRRSLSSGAPLKIEVTRYRRSDADRQEAKRRYPEDDRSRYSSNADLFENARGLHERAREVLLADGYHDTLAWLFVGGRQVGAMELRPGDQRQKFLMMGQVAEEVRRLGADGVVLTAEAWLATLLPQDDPASELRAGERVDRGETLATHALHRDGRRQACITLMQRAADGALTLGVTSARQRIQQFRARKRSSMSGRAGRSRFDR
jgi:hypothetical protein